MSRQRCEDKVDLLTWTYQILNIMNSQKYFSSIIDTMYMKCSFLATKKTFESFFKIIEKSKESTKISKICGPCYHFFLNKRCIYVCYCIFVIAFFRVVAPRGHFLTTLIRQGRYILSSWSKVVDFFSTPNECQRRGSKKAKILST